MLQNLLSLDQIDDLLEYIGVEVMKGWKGTRQQITCPVHNESNPSCGINAEFEPEDSPGTVLQVFNCFSCGAKGTLPWLLFLSMPEEFKSVTQAKQFIEKRYGVTLPTGKTANFNLGNIEVLRRYEDKFKSSKRGRFELPRYKLALYYSGEETYNYFFNRGFTEQELQDYMIGYDAENKTVTMPVFWEDGALAGLIGRYIAKNRAKNERFKVYDFPKSSLIYPLDKLEVINNTIIGCESIFDCIKLRRWGYTNAIAIMGDMISSEQAKQIQQRCTTFIGLWDNDFGGRKAIANAKNMLKGITYKEPTYFPKEGKDPDEWGEEETNKVIQSASVLSMKNIKRM